MNSQVSSLKRPNSLEERFLEKLGSHKQMVAKIANVYTRSSEERKDLPAFLLSALSIFSLLFCFYKLTLYHRIDPKETVIKNQKNVEQLKYYKKLELTILYVIIPLFSTAFLIVIAKAWFDYNMYNLGEWLIYFMGGSILVAIIIVFILKRFPDRNLQETIFFLREINEFDRE